MLPQSQRKGDCKPCRESKAQCDRKRPRCSECISTSKACGGYDMGHIFINVNSARPPPLWNRTQNAQKYLVLDLASQPASPEQLQFPVIPSIEAVASPALPAFPNPDPTNLSGMVTVFLDLYYRRFGPDKTSTDALQPGFECGGWRSLLPSWVGQSPILDTAISALATCFVGTQYQQDRLMDYGRNMYLNALQMLQQALAASDSGNRRDLTATTLVMSSTELFMSNGGGPSQGAHIEGATRLLHCAFKWLDMEELHIYILHQGLFEAISTRRSYDFSSPSYRPLVRQLYTVPRTFPNDLYFRWCEIILPLPNILAAVDNISSSSTPTPPPTILTTLNEIVTLEQYLAPWYETVKASMPGPWTLPAAQISADSVPFPLHFMSIEVCTLYVLHWASQLLILEARYVLSTHLPAHHGASASNSTATPQDLSAQMSEYASLICRSVQFCAHDTSFAATENIFFPLSVVACFYMRRGDDGRLKWCVAAFRRIAEEQKIGYGSEKLELAERRVGREA
ncbi:hypothetical protein BDV95DRAFT_68581 [Massariosphaeria phaeospora]|uniref:Zn(2)-C6 fungal-type domain-containing protein n=1 Tax=Massariosphaeria phaeospora TaxID=100035 RepID=A0A7C8M7H0_9PLEO|nr:hypothetical protein BDV95DRAFT_68581 [Massariosphaeria phaeospora]